VLYAYIDESYSDNGYYYVGVLLVDEAGGHRVRLALDAMAAQVAADYGISPDAEFHGYDMFHYEGAWHSLTGKHRVSAGIYRAAMQAVHDAGGKFFFHGLDTVRQAQRYGRNAYPPHIVALQFVLEAVHNYASGLGEEVTVIADRVPDQRAHEARIAQFQKIGSIGYRSSKLESIRMPFQWEDSRLHRNLQAVDMATFVFRRYDSHRETAETARAAVERIMTIIRRSTVHSWVWIP
jgi:hypothetical protein